MCIVTSFVGFTRKLLWTFLLLSTACKCDTPNISDGNTSISTATTTTTTAETTTTITFYDPTALPSLALCQCGVGEVMNDTGQCQPWPEGTTVPTKDPYSAQPGYPVPLQHLSTDDFSVTVMEPQCQYREIDIHEGQFEVRLLHPTDLLVTEGDLHGLRVANFCIHHQQSGADQVKVTARGCVTLPVVPRCCEKGEHMHNGDCISTSSPSIPFDPPIYTGPHGDEYLAGAHFPWSDLEENVNKPICEVGHIMKKVKLDGRNNSKHYLFAHPQGVQLTWIPEGDVRDGRKDTQFCVDITGNYNTYYAYTCQLELKAYCKNEICTNYTLKCCLEGESMHKVFGVGCVPFNKPLEIPFPNSSFLYGFHPSCKSPTDIANFTFEDDSLIHMNNKYSFDEYCIDNFVGDDFSAEIKALACLHEIQVTTWHLIKFKVTIVCLFLSIGFLALLILLYSWIPKLKEEDGKIQFFHTSSLFLLFSVSVVLKYLPDRGFQLRGICMSSAFVLQFAYLSVFFWMNIMCFDVWRILRNLQKHKCKPVPVSTWKYMIYAIGGPLTITVVTIIVQFIADKDGSIPWLIHPNIGDGRCWFPSRIELLAYLYGPTAILFVINLVFIGTTYYYIKIIRGENTSAIQETENTETTGTPDNFAVYWQRCYLLALVTGCWLTDILSLIPPEDLWVITSFLNHLQGVFIFFIFLTEKNKRAILKEQLPKLLSFSNMMIEQTNAAQRNINNQNRRISKKISPSAMFSKGSSSTSSYNLNENEASISTSSTGITPLTMASEQL